MIPFALYNGHFYGGIEKSVSCPNASFGLSNKRDTQIKRPRTTVRQRGHYLYAGPVWPHFGHMITESLHRLWAYDPTIHDGIVFNCQISQNEPVPDVIAKDYWEPWSQVEFPDFLLELLGYMGISASIKLVKQPTVFDVLDVPEPGSVLGEGVKKFYKPYLEKYQKHIEDLTSDLVSPEKMYFSRRHILAEQGGVLGVSFFEEILSRNGFHVVQPEKYSLLQQFAFELKSKEIAFDDGSSIHTTELFTGLKPRYHMFPRRPFLSHCVAALETRGADLTVLSSLNNIDLLPDFRGVTPSPACIGIYKDPDEVMERLKKLNIDTSSYSIADFKDMEEREIIDCSNGNEELINARISIWNKYR